MSWRAGTMEEGNELHFSKQRVAVRDQWET